MISAGRHTDTDNCGVSWKNKNLVGASETAEYRAAISAIKHDSYRDVSEGRLCIEFGQGRLIKADSWIRTMWRDLFDNESRPILFTLKEDGTVNEGRDFQRIYCP